MQDLLDKAQGLVSALQVKIRENDDLKKDLNRQQASNDAIKTTLDNFQAELLDRDSKIKPIENLGEAQRKATESQANADLEWTKIRGEWDALKTRKQSDQIEFVAERNDLQQKRELYDRGATENAITKKKLDDKLKKLKEASV